MTRKLTPDDARVTHHTAPVRGKTYHYVVASPPAGRPARGTIVLVHGFPDLGFGWRYQVPVLAEELGLQVIVPDMLGYGQTDAPAAPDAYAHKSICADLVALVDHVGVVGGTGTGTGTSAGAGVADQRPRFFVGGHDWGGAVAWRMALWHADRLRGVFSVCTPYFAPSRGPFVPLAASVQRMPNFRYQLQFAGDELWRFVDAAPARARQFLQAMYGGRAALSGDAADAADAAAQPRPRLFDTAHGVDLGRLATVGPSPLLSTAEIEYYAAAYARHGLRGPTNWYRTSRHNYDDERALVARGGGGGNGTDPIRVPSLMLSAADDSALPPALAEQMGAHFANLTRAVVPGSHWALWQAHAAVNEHIKSFLGPLLDGTAKAAL